MTAAKGFLNVRLTIPFEAVVPMPPCSISPFDQTRYHSEPSLHSSEGIQKLVSAFEAIGVSKARIEKFCQCRAEAIKPAQIIRLRNVYASIKDGMSGPDDWFEPEEKPAEAKPSSEKKTLKDKLKEHKAKSDTAPQPIEEPPAASAIVAHEPSTQSDPSPIPKTAEPPLDESWLRAYDTSTIGGSTA